MHVDLELLPPRTAVSGRHGASCAHRQAFLCQYRLGQRNDRENDVRCGEDDIAVGDWFSLPDRSDSLVSSRITRTAGRLSVRAVIAGAP